MTGGVSGLPAFLDPAMQAASLPLPLPTVPDIPWTKEQDEVLREGVLRYGCGSWDKIAQHMGNYGRTAQCCTDRWAKVKDGPVKVGENHFGASAQFL